MGCSFRLRGEDISWGEDSWKAILGWEVRISGAEDIWEAVLGWEARISGEVMIFGRQFWCER